MLKELFAFIKKQIIFFSGVVFGAVVASVVGGLLAFITETNLLEVAKVTNLLECYQESANE
tara:strand:+ start:224 stop:406 length:183 start_codon:yes stop_codon:yes gene_type:complete